MCTKDIPSHGKHRPVLKIDNAATFPEHNKKLRCGLNWAVHNYSIPLSPSLRDAIKNISNLQIEQIASLMKQRGKSEAAIQAFKKRVLFLKQCEPNVATLEELDFELSNL